MNQALKKGTPKSLDEAILFALCTCPAPSTEGDVVEHFKAHICDYLSQGFAVSYLETKTQRELTMLQKLFKRITGRETA